MAKRMGNERGFTLVELLVVLVIVATLLGMVAPNPAGIVGAARSGAAAEELDAVPLKETLRMTTENTWVQGWTEGFAS